MPTPSLGPAPTQLFASAVRARRIDVADRVIHQLLPAMLHPPLHDAVLVDRVLTHAKVMASCSGPTAPLGLRGR